MKKHQVKSADGDAAFLEYAKKEIKSWGAGSTLEQEDVALLTYVSDSIAAIQRTNADLVSYIEGVGNNALKAISGMKR